MPIRQSPRIRTIHTEVTAETAFKWPVCHATGKRVQDLPITVENSSEEERSGTRLMKNLDLQVIQQALAWLEQGYCVWMCTVIAMFGSAPRGPGSLLVALPTGAFCGSLSGGCVEEDFLERLGRDEFAEYNQIVRYGEGGLAPSLALPCGGVLDVLVERFEPDCQAREHFAQAYQ